MNISQFQIFIGYDPREQDAYNVCKYSIERNSLIKGEPLVHKLYSKEIMEYNRDWGEPQSTDFTFTRFWVPYLSKFTGYSIFCDCDFLFLVDPSYVLIDVDPQKAVSVVQHPGYIPNSQLKMDGIPQHRAYRKNSASFIVFNNFYNKLF